MYRRMKTHYPGLLEHGGSFLVPYFASSFLLLLLDGSLVFFFLLWHSRYL